MIEKAIIPSAGNGSRLRELTHGLPEEIIELGDKRMIEYSIEEGPNIGILNSGVIISDCKESIRKYLNDIFYCGNEERIREYLIFVKGRNYPL